MFSTRLDNFLPFSSNLELSSANSSSLEGSKNLSSGNGLISPVDIFHRLTISYTGSENMGVVYYKE